MEKEMQVVNHLHYGIQKVRIAMDKRILDFKIPLTSRVKDISDQVRALEDTLKSTLEDSLENYPIWTEYLSKIKGIGPLLASSLIAEIGDIKRFDTVSKLWSYFGLNVGYVRMECAKGHKLMAARAKEKCPVLVEKNKTCGAEIANLGYVHEAMRRRDGWRVLYNTRAKTLAWKVGNQLLTNKNEFFKQLYDTRKQAELNKGLSDGHAHSRALRRMIKIFLCLLWVKWRKLEKLPVTKPYVEKVLNHKHIIQPEDAITEVEKPRQSRKKK